MKNYKHLSMWICLLCTRGRCAGEELRRQRHAGSWPCDDQTDAAQTGTAERPQLVAGRWVFFCFAMIIQSLSWVNTVVINLKTPPTPPPLTPIVDWTASHPLNLIGYRRCRPPKILKQSPGFSFSFFFYATSLHLHEHGLHSAIRSAHSSLEKICSTLSYCTSVSI